ncbi:hypothetical protein PIB30_015054 [Stylosanthes scabra]|uniref:Uncharacterized protein n=1 Tax=Stylosanthes scabra TaxID=79078 RepID=A0ABU6Z4C1_9FABA|nr:hypothetical protein [Stylosanthes scabra]
MGGGGLASSSVRRALVKIPSEQLLRESYRFTTKALACFQVGLEGTLSSKLKTEKGLTAAQDQIVVLTTKRDSALAYLPLKKELASCQLSLENEQKRAEASEKDVRDLNTSLMEKQMALSKATASAEYWEAEWKKLGDGTLDMCQETLETVLDQVTHLSPGIDFSVITLDTRWDPKTRRIIDRKNAADEDLELVDDPPHADAVSQEQRPEELEQVQQVQQSEPRSVAEGGRQCLT